MNGNGGSDTGPETNDFDSAGQPDFVAAASDTKARLAKCVSHPTIQVFVTIYL